MFLFEVKCLIWSAMEIQFFELHFLQPILGGHPVLSGHLAITFYLSPSPLPFPFLRLPRRLQNLWQMCDTKPPKRHF